MRKGPLIVAGAACLALALWRLTCPALIRYHPSIFAGGAQFVVVNPIRAGAARASAESLLKFLRDKDVAGASRSFPLLDKKLLEEDALEPPIRWRLDDVVEDPGGGLDFEYVNETKSNAMGGYIWIYCIKDSNGAWTVSRYERVF
jgi:hypothetical protein